MCEMIGKIVLGLWIVYFWSLSVNNQVDALNELKQFDESLDEVRAVEIWRVLVTSMQEYEQREQHRGGRQKRRTPRRVCYEDVGCFENMLPSSPEDIGTRFIVYSSRKARSVPIEVPAVSFSDKVRRVINPELPTKIIVHGFDSHCNYSWAHELRLALMSTIDCNIVCVDWGPGSKFPNYFLAVANTELVGRQLAKFVRSLNVSLDKIHIIGFSLGAHVAGYAGAELKNISRITGLDPAGPNFEGEDPDKRLDETDAQFVDVIHTNVGSSIPFWLFGTDQPMGHVDFYPNGGKKQVGCKDWWDYVKHPLSTSMDEMLCNHRRAYKLFIASMRPNCRFPAFPCESGYDGFMSGECFPCGSHPNMSCGDMGFYSDKWSARGRLYLATWDDPPLCSNHYQVKVYNRFKNYGSLEVRLISNGSISDTLLMTQKDRLKPIIQKIVALQLSFTYIDAIQVKYTLLNGWISKGSENWTVDKIEVINSYGSVYSACNLEFKSGQSIDIKLYPNSCNSLTELDNAIPIIPEEVTKTVINDKKTEKEEEVKQTGIGPFTKKQNYIRDSDDGGLRNKLPQRGLGPFTKEQNIEIANPTVSKDNNTDGGTKNYQSISPLPLGELANDGKSSSVENNINEYAEHGRGFSSSNLSQPPLTLDRSHVAPVITMTPKLAGQPTVMFVADEPVSRLGMKNESGRSLKIHEITEPVLRPRGTRQEPPMPPRIKNWNHEDTEERSSINGFYRVQFLPKSVARILFQAETYTTQSMLPFISQYVPSFTGAGRTDRPKYLPLGGLFADREDKEKNVVAYRIDRSQRLPVVEETQRKDQWLPLAVTPLHRQSITNDRTEKSRTGEWVSEGGSSWSPRNDSDTKVTETKIDDWLPQVPAESSDDTALNGSTDEEQRKFIPLKNFALGNNSPTVKTKALVESETKRDRSIVFPNIDEKKNDPRTRYIPLIPEEDLRLVGRSIENKR